MATYEVNGFALGTMIVRYEIEDVSSEEEAIKKAESLFKKGEYHDMRYSDDDAACLDFCPSRAEKML